MSTPETDLPGQLAASTEELDAVVMFNWPQTKSGQEYARLCMWHLAGLAVNLPSDHSKLNRVDTASALLEQLALKGSLNVFDEALDIATQNWSQIARPTEHPQAVYDAYFDACVIVKYVLTNADRDDQQ